MKKIIALSILVLLVSVSAFANHPSGWGVGFVGQGSFGWGGAGAGGAALSLKPPQSPLYWGMNLGLRKDVLSVSVTADRYVIDNILVSEIDLGLYFGLGAYVGVYSYSGDASGISISAGARAPIGVYIFPVDFLEVFLAAVPSLGLGLGIGDRVGLEFPEGGIGGEFGIRFWF